MEQAFAVGQHIFDVSVSLLFHSGVVHSGFCPGVSAGKVHEEGLFWRAKGCRNGGSFCFDVYSHASVTSVCLISLSFFQHLIERSWYAVTETCLAFTVFRDDFSPRFVALFTLLLFLKCFHWLAEDRVDFVSNGRETTFCDLGSQNEHCGFNFKLTPLLFSAD